MPILSLTAVARDSVRLREAIPAEDPVWSDSGITLSQPLRVDLVASWVGEGVLVRGEIETELAAECRRCLTDVPVHVRDTVDLLFEPLTEQEEADLSGEVYPLPERSDKLDLTQALREQLLLRVPEFVVCSEGCQGLCPQCGVNLNHGRCDCRPPSGSNPWSALKDIKFD